MLQELDLNNALISGCFFLIRWSLVRVQHGLPTINGVFRSQWVTVYAGDMGNTFASIAIPPVPHPMAVVSLINRHLRDPARFR